MYPCLDSGFWFIVRQINLDGFDAKDRLCANSPYGWLIGLIALILYGIIYYSVCLIIAFLVGLSFILLIQCLIWIVSIMSFCCSKNTFTRYRSVKRTN